MPSSDEMAGNPTGVPPILNKYKEFIPVDLGPGQHLTDFAKVPNASADGANVGANVANAASGTQSAVSDQISPIPSDNKVDIGNIGKMSESNRNLVLESGVRSCAEQFRQHCQHGDPAINDFDFGTSVTNDISPVMEPTEAEIQWYKENYGDDPENMEPENDWSDMEPTEDEIKWYKENYGNDPDDMTHEEETAYIASVEALTSYLRDWWTREKERRAKERSADDDDFFKRLSRP